MKREDSFSRGRIKRWLIEVVCVLLLIASCFFAWVIHSDYKNNYKQIQQQYYRLICGEIVHNMESGIRYGKDIERFYGMDTVFEDMYRYISPTISAYILNRDGGLLYSAGNRGISRAVLTSSVIQSNLIQGSGGAVVTDTLDDGSDVMLFPIHKPDGAVAGGLVLVIGGNEYRDVFNAELRHTVRTTLIVALSTMLAVVLLISLYPSIEQENARKRLLGIVLLLTIVSMAVQGTAGFLNLQRQYKASMVEQALSDAPESLGVIFLLTEETYRASGLSDRFIISAFELDMPDEAERARLFTGYMKKFRPEPELSIKELAVKFHFVPGQIKNAVRQAEGLTELGGASEITAETMHRCCYNQVVHKLDSLAARITPAYGWDDLILPPDQIKLMQQACDHIRYSMRVFNEWGFGRRVTYGRGLSMLFAGPPGTGKTMGAQVVANQLHMELYKVQISQVISKYIGETEKNLRAVFQEAKRSNCILFFDECDAIFGKRSEVKDAHDRYANVETAYLLQQVEEFDGVCILATNLLQNIDAAFMRRISFVIHFPFPDKETRAKLYKSMLPPDVPVADNVDFDFMAEKFEITGGSIKNIVVNAAFLAAAKDAPIGMEELLVAAVNELRKNEIVVVRKDLGEYADLVFK